MLFVDCQSPGVACVFKLRVSKWLAAVLGVGLVFPRVHLVVHVLEEPAGLADQHFWLEDVPDVQVVPQGHLKGVVPRVGRSVSDPFLLHKVRLAGKLAGLVAVGSLKVLLNPQDNVLLTAIVISCQDQVVIQSPCGR